MLSADIDSVHLMGATFSLTIVIVVSLAVRERMLKEKYALIWFLIGIFIFIISIFRNLMDCFANAIGVYYAPSAFFAILIACAYLLLLNASICISGLKRNNKLLTQELGLAKLRLEELEKNLKG